MKTGEEEGGAVGVGGGQEGRERGNKEYMRMGEGLINIVLLCLGY